MLAQGCRDAQHHRFRPADKGGIDVFDVDPVLKQLGAFVLCDQTGEQINLLRVGFQNMDHVQTTHIEVFEVLKLLPEHDRVDAFVGIDQRKAGLGLAGQSGAQDRQDRGDAGATGEAQILPFRICIDLCVKTAHRGHGLHHVPDLQV